MGVGYTYPLSSLKVINLICLSNVKGWSCERDDVEMLFAKRRAIYVRVASSIQQASEKINEVHRRVTDGMGWDGVVYHALEHERREWKIMSS